MKKGIKLVLALTSLLVVTGCGSNNSSTPSTNTEEKVVEKTVQEKYGEDFQSKILANNSPYFDAVDEAKQGTIETLSYTTHSYALEYALEENDIMLDKTVNVYLPYSYSDTKQYNVLYLLHGTEGEGDPANMADYWLCPNPETGAKSITTKKIVDNAFSKDKCADMIIVSCAYYSRVEGKSPTAEQYLNVPTRLGETDMTEWQKDVDENDYQTIWTRFFGEELVNDIIPLVESKYSTFSGNDITPEAIVASRDHRAYVGLSRGSMTSVNSIMMKHLDAFSYIGSFSGIWAEFDRFETAMNVTFKDYDVKYWYNGNGTADFSHDDHTAFRDNVLTKLSSKFVDEKNYAFVDIKGAAHAYNNWMTHLVNVLVSFFKK